MTDNEITIPEEYKNLNPILEAKIESANSILRNLAESILDVYNAAKEVGYDPKEARKIVEVRIINVTPRYIRKILPTEAKFTQMARQPRSEPSPIIAEKISANTATTVNIPQTPPNIVDVEVEQEEAEPIIQQPQERRTPEAPDNSMVEQLNHINIKLKKELEDLHELMDIRMTDKDKRIQALVNDVLNYEKAIKLLTDENTQLKAELARHRRLEELRLEAQRKAIKEWRNPGDKP